MTVVMATQMADKLRARLVVTVFNARQAHSDPYKISVTLGFSSVVFKK